MRSITRQFFVAPATDRARMPVALLSGFLGSGKTTLVNALLRDPRLAGTAVAVNEFGDVPLDRDLIDHGADRTVVMANGCLCCNLSGDMEDAVMRLFSRREAGEVPRFERLIIEPSGLSDPAPIAQAILRNPVMARSMRLEAIVTTVDALFAEAQIARHAETRKQIALADRLVLTKTDLVADASVQRLRAELRRLNPVAPIRDRAIAGGSMPPSLFPPSFFDPGPLRRSRARAAPGCSPTTPGILHAMRPSTLLADVAIALARFRDLAARHPHPPRRSAAAGEGHAGHRGYGRARGGPGRAPRHRLARRACRLARQPIGGRGLC